MVKSDVSPFRDPRLSLYVASASPAWLWSADGTRMLWANAVGAAMFGVTPSNLANVGAIKLQIAGQQIARLAHSLAPGGAPRLERVRGLGGGVGRTLICACSCLSLAKRADAILVAATAPAGP